MNSSPDKTYRRFLLGIASEDEECRVEEAVLAGKLDALFLQTAEDELIDDYLFGSITHEERQGFERHFLVTEERRQRLRFASTLIEYSQRQPVEANSGKWELASPGRIRVMFSWKRAAFLAAAASVLLAVLAGLALVKLHQQTQVAQETRNELTRLQAVLAAGSQTPAQVVKPSTGILVGTEEAAERMPVIEFPSATRSALPVQVRVPANTQTVGIDLKLSTPFAEEYLVILLSESGQLWAQEFPGAALSPAKQTTIVLPASILVSGNYHLQLYEGSATGQFKPLRDCVIQVVRE